MSLPSLPPLLLLSLLLLCGCMSPALAVQTPPTNKFSHTAALNGNQDCALLTLVVDESGSMFYEQVFLQDNAVPGLINQYRAKGYDHIFVCSNGFGHQADTNGWAYHGCVDAMTAWSNPPTSAEKGQIMGTWRQLGGVEDAYLGVLKGMENTPAVISSIDIQATCKTLYKNMILLTDEVRNGNAPTQKG